MGSGALKGLSAFATGNPLFFTNVLKVSIGRDLGALKGLSLKNLWYTSTGQVSPRCARRLTPDFTFFMFFLEEA